MRLLNTSMRPILHSAEPTECRQLRRAPDAARLPWHEARRGEDEVTMRRGLAEGCEDNLPVTEATP